MRTVSFAALALAAACAKPAAGPEEVLRPASYADPRVGSGGMNYAFGSAFVGAVAPDGMVKLGPDTSGPYGDVKFLHYSGYWAGDDTIEGFSHLHLHGTGATDYGILGVMPRDSFSAAKLTKTGYASTFAKKSEVATPGYYAVTLDQGGIRAGSRRRRTPRTTATRSPARPGTCCSTSITTSATASSPPRR